MENNENFQTNWNICKYPWYDECYYLTKYHLPLQLQDVSVNSCNNCLLKFILIILFVLSADPSGHAV